MTYNIAVHPDVLDMVDCLPAITRAKLVALFRSIMECGIAYAGPEKLHWNRDDVFTLTVTQNIHDARMVNGAMAKGFCKAAFDGTFYISALFCLQDGQCLETGQRHSALKHRHLPDGEDAGHYVTLDARWIGQELANPFVRRAYESADSGLRVPVTAPTHIENCFFHSIEQIHRTMLKALDCGSPPPLPEAVADRVCYRVRFDADGRSTPGERDLAAYLESFRKWPHTLALVNFTDELDPLSMAQRCFFNLVPLFARGQYPDLKIQIVDVVIRDRLGRRAYKETFRRFTGREKPADKAAPFTMVLGGPVEEKRGNPCLPADKDRRLLDIDLFAGCRGPGKDRNGAYKANLRRATHDVMRIAGMLTDGVASIPVKNFRGRSERDVSKAVVDMAMTSVVVVVRDERDSAAFRVARAACCHVALLGYPYVSIILADTVEDHGLQIVLNTRKGQNYVYANPPDDPIRDDDQALIRLLIEDLEEAYQENPYLTEIIHGKPRVPPIFAS